MTWNNPGEQEMKIRNTQPSPTANSSPFLSQITFALQDSIITNLNWCLNLTVRFFCYKVIIIECVFVLHLYLLQSCKMIPHHFSGLLEDLPLLSNKTRSWEQSEKYVSSLLNSVHSILPVCLPCRPDLKGYFYMTHHVSISL